MGDKRFALERVLSTARHAFEQQPYDRVSIAQIALAARCSTATIYETYGSKRELYEFVLLSKLRATAPLLPNTTVGNSALDTLLCYAHDRIAFFADTTRPFTYLRPEGLNAARLIHETMARSDPVPAVAALIGKCQDRGWIREGDAAAIAYVICSSLAFEPLIVRLMFGEDRAFDAEPVIRTTFRCFLTPPGIERLDRFLGDLRQPGSAMSPPQPPAIHAHYQPRSAVN